ncbi:MAG: hypothetical protein AB7N54_19485 [Alphaproteobacteria bacterium]
MATLADILARKWPGARWSLRGDDYASLRWAEDAPCPSEQDIRRHAAEVDADMAEDARAKQAQAELLGEPGALLRIVAELAAAIADLQAQTGLADPARQSAIAALETRLRDPRN